MGFLPSCDHVSTTVWLYHLDFNKMHGKKLEGNYTRILTAILSKFWKQLPSKQQLYDHLPTVLGIVQVVWTKHAEHYLRSKDWTHKHYSPMNSSAGWSVRAYIYPLCADIGCCLEDQLGAMNNRDRSRAWLDNLHFCVNVVFFSHGPYYMDISSLQCYRYCCILFILLYIVYTVYYICKCVESCNQVSFQW